MKRLLFVAAIVAALAIPAFAYAARSSHFQGAVKDGETVTFTVGKQHHHPVVSAFSWNDVPVTCQQPPETVSTYTFTHHGHRAEGTLQINGDTFEGNGCTSGKLEWHARRVPQH